MNTRLSIHDHRNAVLSLLNEYKPCSDIQQMLKDEYKDFILKTPLCFYRGCFDDGHIIVSCCIINYERTHILLHHHKKLDEWTVFGWHCDGNPDVFDVIKREVNEETGIDKDVIQWYPELIGLFKYLYPIYGNEPEHYHYDIMFTAFVPMDTLLNPEDGESTLFHWVPFEDLNNDEYKDRPELIEWCDVIKTLPYNTI